MFVLRSRSGGGLRHPSVRGGYARLSGSRSLSAIERPAHGECAISVRSVLVVRTLSSDVDDGQGPTETSPRASTLALRAHVVLISSPLEEHCARGGSRPTTTTETLSAL